MARQCNTKHSVLLNVSTAHECKNQLNAHVKTNAAVIYVTHIVIGAYVKLKLSSANHKVRFKFIIRIYHPLYQYSLPLAWCKCDTHESLSVDESNMNYVSSFPCVLWG